MAVLKREGDDLILELSGWEEAEAVHGDLRVPLFAVRSVELLNDAHRPVDRGFKVGSRIPGVVEVATVLSGGQKIFAAVHHDTPRGLRILLDGANWDEWIVGCAEPEAVIAELSLPTQVAPEENGAAN
jgi:hypothetical protein